MAESNPWRDKYRRSLAQQEQLEKTLAAQQTMLHRTVNTLSAAAEGHDSTLDERLQAIRASIKHNDVSGFDRMLKSLPRICEEADSRQQDHWQDINKALENIAKGVHKQSPEADIKAAVKHFSKQLPKSAPLIPASLKRVLGELNDLQKQALSVSGKGSSGLLGRLFSKDEAPDSATDSSSPAVQEQSADMPEAELAIDADWEEMDEQGLLEHDAAIEGEMVDNTPLYERERNIPEAILHQRHQDDSPSPQVPERVSIILMELLDQFKTMPAAEKKANKARKRINQGLRWFELAPTLEDIRDFLLQAYLSADTDYKQYLERLYGELSDILDVLGISIKSEEQARAAASSFHEQVNKGMVTINQALQSQNNIDSLKHAVESHVQQLQTALLQFKQETEGVDDSGNLAQQLHSLTEKVREMERNEELIRENLEQEKQRAITDSLTGLPNREAYGERVHQEMLRWQRYKHPLSLAVIDIDFFKKINDDFGHQTGDKVLKIIANAVEKRLREVDFIARYGGEEFVVLLPETSADNASLLLNRIREGLQKAPFRYKDQKMRITVSIGIAEFKEGEDSESAFARADQALYNAKESGRNKCLIAE